MGGLLGMGSSSGRKLPSVVEGGLGSAGFGVLASNAEWFSRSPNTTVALKMDYIIHDLSIRCCY